MLQLRRAVGIIASFIQLAVLTLHDARSQDADKALDSQSPVGRWRAVADMSVYREYAGGIRLHDGRVLAVSGHPLNGKSIASAELYDPKAEKWSETGSLRQARNGGNRATLLPDGRVLLAGGHSDTEVIRGAEIYEPTTGKWSDAGTLGVGRDPEATLLKDGRVLVSGGMDWYTDTGKAYAVAEIYDPATGKWTETGPLGTPRYEHRMVTLDDGRVLAIGGYELEDKLLSTAELYDPRTGRWQPTKDLPQPRAWFGHVKLRDGRVLVAGGYTGRRSQRAYLASAIVYDPKSGCWSETDPMQDKRAGFGIALLSDGQVLVAGGVAEGGLELKKAELFDPQKQTWRPAAPMNVPRRNHRAALLTDGSVLVIGGSNLLGGRYLRSCEIFSY